MEMLDGSRRLMEEGRCTEETGGHRGNTLVQLLLQKDPRRQRMAQCLAVALLLMISAALALMITVLLGGRGADREPTMQPDSHASGSIGQQQQQEDDKNPSAMLTAPTGNNTDGQNLEWESEIGHVFLHGGFSYSNGNLVVPRKGIYRVFLQITYESKDNHKCDKQEKLTNRVFYIQDNYPDEILLLSSVDTVSCSLNLWTKSLYTSGLFSLEAQDRLFVRSSHRGLIAKNEHQVFFGAELLPQ
ncbi:tumor necrosis factor ligand superfamily member 15-like [Centropristis striata]|uniref:tumor necrosis factor ligand superfamily member 15-like n=1 Tax=Centropristis striata TaxID=184440 RepID=UPI0027E0F0DB|nr:tumor necrosis factor ligand superfamily member 15-like [Centropristis striata]